MNYCFSFMYNCAPTRTEKTGEIFFFYILTVQAYAAIYILVIYLIDIIIIISIIIFHFVVKGFTLQVSHVTIHSCHVSCCKQVGGQGGAGGIYPSTNRLTLRGEHIL